MHLFLKFLTMIEVIDFLHIIYKNHVHILKSVIFQEVLDILYLLFQLFFKKLIVILGGQNWLIPYIVLFIVK